jgi:aspartate aminotransferase
MNAVKNFDIKVLEYSHSADLKATELNYLNYKNQDYLSILRHHYNRWALLLQWEALWIREMRSSSLNHFMLIIMVFYCIRVNVVPVISSIDTGFALPPIADFEKQLRQKQKQSLYVIQETQQVICIRKRK